MLEFGPVFDKNIDIVSVKFSDNNGKLHTLKDPPIAPRDTKKHKYELFWGYDGGYEIIIDEELKQLGQIEEDFMEDD